MPKQNAEHELKVEQWTIGRLQPYAGNAKVHPDAQVGEIGASIEQFGFVSPILVDAKGVIIAGHGRLEAAKRKGLKKVPVIKLGHLSDDQVKALRIADNSIGISGTSWDPAMLEAELASLKAVKFELEPLGLDRIELPDLEDIPAAPPPRANRSKTTIFLAVKNEHAEKARKACAAALNKAGIEHNL
jgi:ParB-like chromosome segregation protein Spo0J